MQLSPRYDGPAVLHLDVDLGDPSVPLFRQRRRMAALLSTLDDDQWAAPSRCDGWSVQDVVAHLVGTDGYWTMSMAAGLQGTPTRFLERFDPVATPAAMVGRMHELSPQDVLVRYAAGVDALAATLADVPAEAWSLPTEAPPGHIELQAVVLHALWDAWIHERDILLPLGLEQVAEDDEIRGSLVYAAVLGPTLLAAGGSARELTLSVEATTPDVAFVVEAGPVVTVRDAGEGVPPDAVLRGDAIALTEGLSFRAPLDHDIPAEHQWVLGGLAQAFDIA